MSRKNLANELSKLKFVKIPDISLEQYMTDSDIASFELWKLGMQNKLKDKKVADFGAGTGMFGIGCLLSGAAIVDFYEKDKIMIESLFQNLEYIENTYEIGEYNVIKGDLFSKKIPDYDVVVMNPPFGTRNTGVDMAFLEIAMNSAKTILTFHKASTKEHVDIQIRHHGYKVIEYEEYRFPLKKSMPQHKKHVEYIIVGAWIIERNS